MAISPTFFLGNKGQENIFYDILVRENDFPGFENNKFKKSKNWLFSKGFNPWFWSESGHFSNFFLLRNISHENVFNDILERKTTFYAIKRRSSKSRKTDIFPKGYHMVLVQKWPFFQVFFLGNIGQENVFFDILERKNDFLGYKNKKFKKSKNWHFSKRVNPWFWSKNGHFSNFFI